MIRLSVPNMSCGHCTASIQRAILAVVAAIVLRRRLGKRSGERDLYPLVTIRAFGKIVAGQFVVLKQTRSHTEMQFADDAIFSRTNNDIANRINMRHIGAHLRIYGNKTTLIDINTCFIRINGAPIRCTPYRNQHTIIDDWPFGGIFTLKSDFNTVFFRLNLHDFGF